jgi:Fe-S-cluster containining protein
MDLADAFRELEEIYGDLDRELAALRPRCGLSGRCCRFREYGHELWTTPIEFEYLLRNAKMPSRGSEGVCPFLQGGRCGARPHRMLGCRIYFCDPAYASAMGPLYERYHARIRDLHRRHGVPYRYFEFLPAAREAGFEASGS